MVKTKSSMIACVFICILVACNTLICTAIGNLNGRTNRGKSGQCVVDGEAAGQPVVCACCLRADQGN
ncbi:hypothetical protein MKX01_035827 [Papaver californicum]|nr:hypothetical protein MKX01_035827 [Papaver californicum]